jgi:hypothetical protein
MAEGGSWRSRHLRLEHRRQPLLPRRQFHLRIAVYAGTACSMIAGALGIGMLGYHLFEGLGWTDAFLNASMILGGMGPVSSLHTEAGKIFAGFYALFSGLVFLVAAGIAIAPQVHRLLHRFHVEADEEKTEG